MENSSAPSSAPITNAPESVSQNDKPDSGLVTKALPNTKDKAPEAKPAQTAAEKEALRKWKLKVDGREEEVDEKELVKRASLASAAQKRMQESAELKKKFAGLVEAVRGNPVEALFDPALGLSKDQIRDAFEQWYKREVIDEESLTPEQKKHRDTENELKKLRDEKAAEQKQKETERMQQLQDQHRQHYDKVIFEALEKANLPKSPQTIKRTAYYMAEALQRGIDAPIEKVMDLVRQDYHQAFSEMFGQSDVAVLEKLLGDDFFNRLRKHDIAKLKNSTPQTTPVAAKPVKAKPEEKSTSMHRVRDYFDRIK